MYYTFDNCIPKHAPHSLPGTKVNLSSFAVGIKGLGQDKCQGSPKEWSSPMLPLVLFPNPLTLKFMLKNTVL